jgi:hypothetical protein
MEFLNMKNYDHSRRIRIKSFPLDIEFRNLFIIDPLFIVFMKNLMIIFMHLPQ